MLDTGGGLRHSRASFVAGPPLSEIPSAPFAELARSAERLDRAWLMALSPMLVLPPAAGPGACGDLLAAAIKLELHPRLIRLGEGAIEAPGVRPADLLDLDPPRDAAAFAALLDWVSAVPPASLWTPWRGDDRPRFELADRLADALPKAPVLFEYLDPRTAASPPADARAFVLDGPAATPSALFLALD